MYVCMWVGGFAADRRRHGPVTPSYLQSDESSRFICVRSTFLWYSPINSMYVCMYVARERCGSA